MKLRTILAANMLLLAANANAIDFSCGGTCDQTILCEVLSDVKAEEMSVSVKGGLKMRLLQASLTTTSSLNFQSHRLVIKFNCLKMGK
ncbi:hypothetical protein OPW33_23250 [Vibrio europaeus]|uniref:hypothetical protein n=1 Tax=Vibrio europaeus TaxID=300876 RepID=UPI0023419888|nr:hypothetical protein [Vibrio europaeus]MDC5842246.1 hypothetical protein [Vibrio europaeus]